MLFLSVMLNFSLMMAATGHLKAEGQTLREKFNITLWNSMMAADHLIRDSTSHSVRLSVMLNFSLMKLSFSFEMMAATGHLKAEGQTHPEVQHHTQEQHDGSDQTSQS